MQARQVVDPKAKSYNRPAMTISRRDLLGALPAVALLPRALTAQAPRQLRARGLHSMTLAVTDVERSLEFYQGLFGMPIQARHGPSPLLRVGQGPKFMALTPVPADGPTGVSRFGIGVQDFNVDRILAVLGESSSGIRAACVFNCRIPCAAAAADPSETRAGPCSRRR